MLVVQLSSFKNTKQFNVYFFIALTVFYCSSLIAQKRSNFTHLVPKIEYQTIEVGRTAQDSLGYIWVTDKNGLYKYDGYDFKFTPYTKIFGKDFTNKQDVLLKKDGRGNFWIATYNGKLAIVRPDGTFLCLKSTRVNGKEIAQITSIAPLGSFVYLGSVDGVIYRYDLSTSILDRITAIPLLRKSTSTIYSITFTGSNTLWLSTRNGEIYSYSIKSKELKKLTGPFNHKTNDIFRLTSDKKGRVWIASGLNGLFRYDPEQNTFKKYHPPSSHEGLFMCAFIFCDKSGFIWVGTDGDGLYKIHPESDEILAFIQNNGNKFSISNNSIIHINEDSHGNLWAVDKNGIINILPFNNNEIEYYSGSEDRVPTKAISMLKSSDGSLWIGTDGDGLNRVYPDGTSIQYSNSKKGDHFFKGRYIMRLLEDSKNNIWIATYQNGLFVYNLKTKIFKSIHTKSTDGKASSDIRFFLEDTKKRIWVASRIGIHVFDTDQKGLATFDYGSQGLSGQVSESMSQTKDGAIWVSAKKGGLFKFQENQNDLALSTFKKIEYYTKRKDDPNDYDISYMAPDDSGMLWLRVQSEFLIRYNTKELTYTSFELKEHLKDLNIKAILVDTDQKLWLSSSNGLHQYNPLSETLKSYYQVDGMQGNHFSRRAAHKEQNGKLYFGGHNGVTAFFPHLIAKEESAPKLYINHIEILNKPAVTILPDQLNGAIEDVEVLQLKSNQSSFSFQFSAIDNMLSHHYYYTYRLNGFDEEWIVPKKERIATYTNIPPGKYTFEVKAAVKKGEWDIPTKKISISIAQPLWNQPWAHIFYFIVFLLILYSIYIWSRLKGKLAVEELKRTNEKELYALKMNFFAKMSHEIQTPLTLISAPIQNMLSRATEHGNTLLKQRLTMIGNNAKRLSRILFELTTIRNKELGQLSLKVTKSNLLNDLKDITLSFQEHAKFKKVDFRCDLPENDISAWYDTTIIEHIFYNLLSNAFKFTPKGGFIAFEVALENRGERIKISVTDSGPGIPKDELEKIFQLFYQSDIGKKNTGTGIGLALTKELVNLHHGSIDVETDSQKGTCFTVRLPIKEAAFAPKEKIAEESLEKTSREVYSMNESVLNSVENHMPLKKLLIVEDNYEMQIFLAEIFAKQYQVLLADDGEEGLIVAKKHMPDLIISDVMMPKKDGFEMSKSLQKNKATSHIPILLLTANETPSAKVLGLLSGAIEYISKPFNANELILTVHNIISRSERLLSKYEIDRISTPKRIATRTQEEIFIENIMTQVEAQSTNSDFKLEELSNTLNMSYSAIYRKFQSITGKTLVDFVRSVRLKKAATLIVKYEYPIAEAAFAVGFNDPKYFSKCFKKQFGKSPVQFRKHAKKIGVDSFLEQFDLEQPSSFVEVV